MAVHVGTRRKIGVHVTLDPSVLATLDAEAARAGVSRSALIQQLVQDRAADEAEERWLLERAEAALADRRNRKRIPPRPTEAGVGAVSYDVELLLSST